MGVANHHDHVATPSTELVNHQEERGEEESDEVPLGIDDTMFVSEGVSPQHCSDGVKLQQRSSVVFLGGGGEEFRTKRGSTVSIEGSSGLVVVRWRKGCGLYYVMWSLATFL